ncbi:MAG: C40 family peptidase [Rhodobacter sp.]|nr:C40 family peptidase [Paracoccaceae bacterium]MCC0075653.1 C40 family peptidase [Rhodobacter sp.]
MSDRRFLRAAEGVAHDSLRGTLTNHRFTAGDWRRVAAPLADLWVRPGGARDRQLIAGTRVCVLLERDGWAFGFDADDGYCGWLDPTRLAEDAPVTHFVCTPGTHLYPAADFKQPEVATLPLNARVQVIGHDGTFAVTPQGWVPAGHLRALDDPLSDPVAVARGLMGTPYLWGGNSRDGIDCSGLVQAARRACGLPCPPDGDVQCAMAGLDVEPGRERAGDLIFWKGHVGMVAEPGRLIHANATHMAVAEEDLAGAIARIAAKGDTVIRRLRA